MADCSSLVRLSRKALACRLLILPVRVDLGTCPYTQPRVSRRRAEERVNGGGRAAASLWGTAGCHSARLVPRSRMRNSAPDCRPIARKATNANDDSRKDPKAAGLPSWQVYFYKNEPLSRLTDMLIIVGSILYRGPMVS
jgi:hypothetical protein